MGGGGVEGCEMMENVQVRGVKSIVCMVGKNVIDSVDTARTQGLRGKKLNHEITKISVKSIIFVFHEVDGDTVNADYVIADTRSGGEALPPPAIYGCLKVSTLFLTL